MEPGAASDRAADGNGIPDGSGPSPTASEANTDGRRSEGSESATGLSNRFKNFFSDRDNLTNSYMYLVVGIPFVILALVRGWGAVFQSGEASAFIAGAIVAGIGELVIEQGKNGFSDVKSSFSNFKATFASSPAPSRDADADEFIWAFVAVAGFLAWNLYFAVADESVQHPTVDWVQIVAFILAAIMLPAARFAFSSNGSAAS